MSIEKVQAFLAAKGMADRVITFEASTATVELAAEAVGVEPGRIAKTMSFLVDGAPLLVILAGDVRVDNHRFKEAFHKKGRMIPFDQVEAFIGHAPGGVCPFAIKEGVPVYLDESLRRLKVDAIELFYQHRFDPRVPVEDVAGTISELVKEGKVRRWGMCEVTPGTIRKAHAVHPLTAIQSEYHLMHRDVENNGVLDVCRELGIGFVPYSPLNRGFLGGCINEYTQFDPNNDNRQTLPRFTPEAMRANMRIVNILQQFGRTRGMTSSQVALGWLLQKAPYIVPIPGTTKLSHLEENLHTLDFTCSPQEWAELENAVAAIPVTGARYNAEQQRQVGH